MSISIMPAPNACTTRTTHVVNVASRQLLSERLQRGGGERRRTRIARTHFS